MEEHSQHNTKLPGFTIKLDKRNWTQWNDQMIKMSLMSSSPYNLITKNEKPDWTAPKLTEINPLSNGTNGQPPRIRTTKYHNDGDEEGGIEMYKEDCKELKSKKTKYESDLSSLFVMIIRNPDELISAELEQMPEYPDKMAEKDIIWLIDKLQFIATGHGGASVALDALDYIELKAETYDRSGFIKLAKEAANARKRFMSRNQDTKLLLETFLDAIMVLKLKGFIQLKDKLNDIYSKKVWPTTDEIVSDAMNYLTTLEAANRSEDNHGQLKANIVELEEDEYKLLALATQMMDLKDRVNTNKEKIKAYRSSIEAFTVSTSNKSKRNVKHSQKEENSQKTHYCLNCGKTGHTWRNCKDKKAICGTCGKYHHTTMHKTVLEIIARREKKTKLPFYTEKKDAGGETHNANATDIDYDDESIMDDLEESYNSMIQETPEQAYVGEDLDDEIDIDDLVAAVNRM